LVFFLLACLLVDQNFMEIGAALQVIGGVESGATLPSDRCAL
jgi:hypothetical protein